LDPLLSDAHCSSFAIISVFVASCLTMSDPSVNELICSVDDYQRVAKKKLSKTLYEYLASGTDDEQTLSENRIAFKLWYLRPRMMRKVSTVSTKTHLLGQKMELPVFVSPAGVMALFDEQGECATARACGRYGTIFGLSQHATRSIEQVEQAAPNTNKWYQCYILKDRKLTLQLLNRAVNAGYQGIFLTVDSPVFGYREADARNGFNALPAPHRLANYDFFDQSSSLDNTYNSKTHPSWVRNRSDLSLVVLRYSFRYSLSSHFCFLLKGSEL
jgi:(S)-2-hydroxy-acid oxidase